MLESPLQDHCNSSGHMRSGRVRTRQDAAGIIHSIMINNEDDYHFPQVTNSTLTTSGSGKEEDECTGIPDTSWTSCMPIDTNAFKFVEQFEWPSSFRISSQQQRQKPNWNKPPPQKNTVTKQRAKAYTIDEMIQIARQTQTSLPTDLDEDADGEEMVLNDRQTQSSIATDTTRDTESVPFNSDSSVNITKSSNVSSSRGVGLITPLDSAESVSESVVGSATENSTGLNSISVATSPSNNSRSQQSTAGSKTMVGLSPRSESHDWDNKWNFIPTATASISPTAKTPRSSNIHCKWDNRCGSPVKVRCDNYWEATTAPVTSTTTNGTANPRRIRKLNESTRSYNETPTIESSSSPVTPRRDSPCNTTSFPSPPTVIVTPRRLQKLQDKSPHDGRSDTATTVESSTIPLHPCRTRRLKSDTTTSAWSATIDRSPRVRPRHRSAGVNSTSRNDMNKSSTLRTEPSRRNWSIFDKSGHFCTCTACATVVLQTSLQAEEFYTHQQRRCCRGPFEKEIAELIADIKKFGYDEEQDEEYDDTVIMARNSRSYQGDALVVLANPLRELSLLCRDVRNIHAIRLFGGVQAVVGAMNALRQQAHEHLQRQRQQQSENGTTTNMPSPHNSQSVEDQCYSTALRDGCSVLQYVAREHAQSNSSSSPGTFAHRISLVMLLSGGGSSANSNSGVQGIVQSMKLFPLDYALQRTGTRALMNMSNSSRDACQAILDASFTNDNNIHGDGDIAANTGINGGNECGYSGIVEELVTVLENFPHCPSIKESALVTLCNLFEKVPDAAMKQLAPRREATEVSADSCSQSIGEISSITTCTTIRTRTTPPTRIPKERTFKPPPPPPVSSPRAIVKVEDITHLLDGVLRLGPKRHYHDENTARSDDDSDDASALWNRVYRLEQRLLIGEVLENVFHGHPRLCFEEKKCAM